MKVNIIGAGLAGLSCAVTLSEHGIENRLISPLPSERSQSALAEGGINGALDTMGENDTPEDHYLDTMKGGAYLNDPEAVFVLTQRAPEIIRDLIRIGVPFQTHAHEPVLRKFGGQKKKRTAYAKSSTGKLIMSAMIDECRKWECEGLTERFCHHRFVRLLLDGQRVTGVRILDTYSGEMMDFAGPVVLCSGGMGGLFPGQTTGTTLNTGNVTAIAFAQGVRLGNLEMIQYHPTTMKIPGKRCLVSEAARGEGGRLFIMREGKPWYFMEEKYPELGNLMPRDVVSREEYLAVRREDTEGPVCLDMTQIPEKVFAEKLSDLRDEIMYYLGIDPMKDPVPIEPGIHYFMGGIDVDDHHRTNLTDLYAAGECCCRYHGANRLGGNSMLGALLGGKIAAECIAEGLKSGTKTGIQAEEPRKTTVPDPLADEEDAFLADKVGRILKEGLGIVRDQRGMEDAKSRIKQLMGQGAAPCGRPASPEDISGQSDASMNIDLCRLYLADAIVMSAMERKESRGAHTRSDYPDKSEACRKMTTAELRDGKVRIGFRQLREEASES